MNIINKDKSSTFSPKEEKLFIAKQDINNQIQNPSGTKNFLKLENNTSVHNTKATIFKKLPQCSNSSNKEVQKISRIKDYEPYNLTSNENLNYCKINKKQYTTNSPSKNENKINNYYRFIYTKAKNNSNKKNISKINIPLNVNKNKFKTAFVQKDKKNKTTKSNNNSCTIENKQKYVVTKLSEEKQKIVNNVIKLNKENKISNYSFKYSSNKNAFKVNLSDDKDNFCLSPITKKYEMNKIIKNETNNKRKRKFCKKTIQLVKISNSKDSKLPMQKINSLAQLNIKDIMNDNLHIDDKNLLFNNNTINNYDIINIIKKKEKMKFLSKSFFRDSKQNLSSEIQIINDFPKERIKHFINEIKSESNKEKYNSGESNKWNKFTIPVVSAFLFNSRDDVVYKNDKDNKNDIDHNKQRIKTNKKRNSSAIKFGENNKKKREILFNFNNKDLNNITISSVRSLSNRATSYKRKRDQHLNERKNSVNDNNSLYSLIEKDLYLQEEKLNEIQKHFTYFNIPSNNEEEYKSNDDKRYKEKNFDLNKKKNCHLKIYPTKLVVERKNKNDNKEINYIVIKRGELLDRMRKIKHMNNDL